MPRIATDPSGFLAGLEAGRAMAVPGTYVNASGLAKASGVTWRILERWITADAQFPVEQRGRTGEPWRFDLVAVLDYLVGRARSLKAGKEARMADVARLAGFGGEAGVAPSPESLPEPGTVADRASDARGMKALAEAQMIVHRLKQMQGEYVRADDTMALLIDMMTTMQTETLAVTAKLDPAGQWPSDQRTAVESELRTVLITVRDKLDARLAEWGRGASA